MNARQKQADREAEKAANHFMRWAKAKLPPGTNFDLTYEEDVDEGEKPYWYLNVAVPLQSNDPITGQALDFVNIEDLVLETAKQYSLLKRFEQSGAGCGFGFRDVNFIQKNRP